MASRSKFRANFRSQNWLFVLGWVDRLHPEWRCQKQPCTNKATRCRKKTKSGLPGRSRRCSRNRKPLECAARRTSNSGVVFLLLTARMLALRFSRSSIGVPHASHEFGDPTRGSLSRSRRCLAAMIGIRSEFFAFGNWSHSGHTGRCLKGSPGWLRHLSDECSISQAVEFNRSLGARLRMGV